MEVVRYSSLEELQIHAAAWDDLAGDIPFRSWTWQSVWWRHYGAIGQLCVLAVFEGADLVGIAPWYRTTSASHGQTIRFLGDVEVCSEYPTVLCRRGREEGVTTALVEWLSKVRGADRWDVLELAPVDGNDSMVPALAQQMTERGCRLHTRPGHGCWRVILPPTWDEYLQMPSKNFRSQIKRLRRQYLDSGSTVWHTARTEEELAVAQRVLVDLHQRRRNSLGQPGCFAWPRYRAFQEEVLPELLRESRLGLKWVEFEGRPIASEYLLLGGRTVYCYQGGISPEDSQRSPGRIALLCAFKEAIEQGYTAFDFLRGNEPYKQQWRAQHQPNLELRIVADRTSAQLRHGMWLAGVDAKEWLKGAMTAMHFR
ncbi:MAG: GNAT family N-acetyltransferase [Planctomycetaceae bacterium]|nr:GNAT family N-acetyltransferase [Planctomycetaceae bacterium]